MVITNAEELGEYARSQIVFDGNGGTVHESAVTATNGLPLPVLTGTFTPTRTGYAFTGYFDAALSGTRYYAADRTAAVSAWDREDESVILYAQWKPHNYVVRFNANGGTGTMADMSCTYDTAAALTKNAFSRTGYTFTGWKRVGSGEDFEDGQSVLNLVSDDDAVVELDAQWTLDTYALTYASEVDCEHANPDSYTVTNAFTFSAPADKPGWEFLGWTPSEITLGSTGAQTITAMWKQLRYDVVIGGKALDADQGGCTYGQSVTAETFDEKTEGLTNIVCLGWIGTGDVPASGTGTQVVFTVTQPSTLTWLYRTNYWFEASAKGGGSVTVGEGGFAADAAGCWVPAGTNVVLETTGDPESFCGWTDRLTGREISMEQNVNVTMDRPLELVARYGADAFAFETDAVTAAKGDSFKLVVTGGSTADASSVKVSVTYASAKASDLILKSATVSGADGVERTGISFPLTLTWAKGDVEPKTITIPTAAGKATDAAKCLLWNLSAAEGLELGETIQCLGTIEKGGSCKADEVYVMPVVSDATGGKVSGGASSKADAKGAFKAVTLKATANKGYWFAGWYDAAGKWVGGDLSLKIAPADAELPLVSYEARFVKEHASLIGTYSGFACVDLEGMTLVKGVTPANVTNACPFTATVAKDGKMSGTVTVGGKKVSFKADGCCEASDEDDLSVRTWATYRFSADEKLWFGKSNVETLQISFERERPGTTWMEYGVARLGGVSSSGDYAPLGAEQSGFGYRATDKADLDLFKPFIGTYTTAVSMGDGLIPLSFSVDKSGKIKATGFYTDGTSLALTGTLTLRSSEPTLAIAYLFATPKALGSGSLCVCISLSEADDGSVSCLTTAQATSYSATCCQASDVYYAYAHVFTPGCWIPEEADPDFGVVRLTSDSEVINILYTSKNGAVTGLGKPLESGFTVKFDAKTGLLTVAKGKTYSIYGVLQDRNSHSYATRVSAGVAQGDVAVSFETLPEPDETFPWQEEGFSLTVGQNAGDGVQPSVTSEGKALALSVSGLPSGLKYDAKTGRITGAPTKAATSTVKITYTYCGRKITRTTAFVVSAKPDGLPLGTYTGLAELNLAGDDNRPADYPFTATLDKNGALSGSITLFGKKATLKASGYDTCTEGLAVYTATLDLKAVDKTWGATNVSLAVESDTLTNIGSSTLVGTHGLKRIEAYRNQTKDTDFATRVAPYAGTYLLSFATTRADEALGETVLSVTVDKKGTVKAAGTFADGTALSASTTLWLASDDLEAFACVAVVPKTFGAGSLALNLAFARKDDEVTVKAGECDLLGAKYVPATGDYTPYALGEGGLTVGYKYVSRAWLDTAIDPAETCLAVTSDDEIFPEALFAWTVKNSAITGVGKTTNKSKVTFTLNDKTGIFTGKFGTYSFFGAMRKGACSGTGTIVGKDGSVGTVRVRTN